MARIGREQRELKKATKDIIFCEDGKSSSFYLDFIKQQFRRQFEIKSCNGGSPSEIIKFANNIIENERSPKYNNKFCVFDLDIINKGELESCKKSAQKNGIKLILCDPNFEYYTLLHFEEYTGNDKIIIKNKLLKYLNKQNLKKLKSDEKFYKKLAEVEYEKLVKNEKLDTTAFERNKKIYTFGHNKTNFYEIIEFIKY